MIFWVADNTNGSQLLYFYNSISFVSTVDETHNHGQSSFISMLHLIVIENDASIVTIAGECD